MQAEVKLQVHCKKKYISKSMLLIYSVFLKPSPVETWVLLSTVVNAATVVLKCCVQTQSIAVLSPGWQIIIYPAFRPMMAQLLDHPQALPAL